MSDPQRTSYDEVPYASLPFPQTHPDRLWVISRLLGHAAPSMDRCRVLELGCAAGGNLMPMALAMPECTFVGIDLSTRQISDGHEIQKKLKIENLHLKAMSITDIGPSFGEFDYIIAHGVYSWVPAHVQEALLRVCNENLSPNGVAYVSYNVHPGWQMRGMIRDMMRYHANRFAEPATKIGQARALLQFLAQVIPPENSAYGMLLNVELDMLSKQPDHYILHEHLEETNEPLYFHEFAERAHKHGLSYFGEAVFSSMTGALAPPEVSRLLSKVAFDIISYEQYMDFVMNRTFRQTLLVHEGISANRKIDWKEVTRLRLNSNVKPMASISNLASNKTEEFRGRSASVPVMRSGEPIIKSALTILAELDPMPIAFDRLLAMSKERLCKEKDAPYEPSENDERRLASIVVQAYSIGAMELTQLPARFVLKSKGHPIASPLARLQAANSTHVANLLHKVVVLDQPQQHILQRLDGTQDPANLVESLIPLHSNGVLKLPQLAATKSPSALRREIGAYVERTVSLFGRMALLVQ